MTNDVLHSLAACFSAFVSIYNCILFSQKKDKVNIVLSVFEELSALGLCRSNTQKPLRTKENSVHKFNITRISKMRKNNYVIVIMQTERSIEIIKQDIFTCTLH